MTADFYLDLLNTAIPAGRHETAVTWSCSVHLRVVHGSGRPASRVGSRIFENVMGRVGSKNVYPNFFCIRVTGMCVC